MTWHIIKIKTGEISLVSGNQALTATLENDNLTDTITPFHYEWPVGEDLDPCALMTTISTGPTYADNDFPAECRGV